MSEGLLGKQRFPLHLYSWIFVFLLFKTLAIHYAASVLLLLL